MKDKGFILINLLFLLLLLGAAAMSLNIRAGLQAKMAMSQAKDAQTYFDQLAVIEQSRWNMTEDPGWRITEWEGYSYHGVPFQRKVTGPDTVAFPASAAYRDVITFSVRTPNASRRVNKSFRYNVDTPLLVRKPRQVSIDNAGNIFYADRDNHSVWKIDVFSGAVQRVAGTGISGFSGDGGPATQARLDSPRGVAVDGSGIVYIADTANNCLRKVTAGIISTVVNTSTTPGSSGDGGAAAMARLNAPYGIWVEPSGNIFLADRGNHRIRKVTAANGIIDRVAGTSSGFAGDGSLATAAQLDNPRSVFVDAAGNIFIADTGNDRIRKVTAATGIITTVAGGGNPPSGVGDGGPATAAALNGPRSVFVDGAGNFIISDTGNNRIRKVWASSGIITTAAGTGTAGYTGDGGPAAAARIDWPAYAYVKNTGEVIISDRNNSCLRQIDLTNIISTLPMTAGPGLNTPLGIAGFHDTAQKKLYLYIADQGNNRIRQLDAMTNAVVTVVGTGSEGSGGDGGPSTEARLNSPAGIDVDASRNIYIADTGNNRIRKVTAATGIITTVAGTGSAGPAGDGGFAVAARLSGPQGVSVAPSGNIYVADTGNNRIRKVAAATGIITTVAGSGTAGGYGGDGGPATSALLNNPQGIWADAAEDIFIADTGNNRIRKVTAATGIITTVAGSGTSPGYAGDGGPATSASLNRPRNVFSDAAGNLYIADSGNHVLRLVNIHNGIISTMAGTGDGGYNGDSQPAVQARFNRPAGIALGGARGGGRIFISDSGNNRIRVLLVKTVKEVYGF